MPRPVSGCPTFSDAPFAGQGASLYVADGDTLVYRRTRCLMAGRRVWIKGTTNPFDLSGDSVPKTSRVASLAGTAADPLEFNYTLPPGLLGVPGTPNEIAVNVRHYRDDVENEDLQGLVTLLVDDSGDSSVPVGGAATILVAERRAAGVVRLFVRFIPDPDRAAPARLRVTFTAGPTSPADLTAAYDDQQQVYEIDTAALSDASAYTITLSAEDDPGTDTLDLVTGYQFTADATGPGAPALVSAEAV